MDNGSVRHPSHYASEGIECIEAMYAISPEMAVYFSVGSALKYLDRAGLKDDEEEDLRKAKECWHMAKRMMAHVGPSDLTHTKPDSLGRIAREMDEWRFERMRDLGEGDFDDLGLFAERIRRLAEKEASDADGAR